MPSQLHLPMKIDVLTQDTSFELGGKSYTLRYDFEALAQFFNAIGVNPVIEPVGKDPTKIAALLFVGLLRHQPDITAEEVKGWFSSGPKTLALTELAFAALRAQLPDPEPEEEPTPPNPPMA